jgi:serine protease Do
MMNENVVFKVKTSKGSGSSVYLKSLDLFVTNYHVVRGHRIVAVEDRHAAVYEAQVVFVNPTSDLAFLVPAAPVDVAPAPCEVFAEAKGRDVVFALGYPLGTPYTETRGIVSSPRKLHKTRYYVQTDAALNPGNSGGPMVNEQGELVGINTFGYAEAENMGFAIPADVLKEDLESFKLNTKRVFSVKCDSCRALTFQESKYCNNCGGAIDATVFETLKPDKLELFVEAALEKMGIKPVLAREGEAYWRFHYGVALVRIQLTHNDYLDANADINTLPSANLGNFYQFLLKRPLPPYKVGINENLVHMTYRFYVPDIDSPARESLSRDLAQFPLKADQMSRHLIKQFACNVTHFARKGALENQAADRGMQAAGLREQARALMEAGKGKESAQTLEQAKALYIKLKDTAGLASSLLLHGDLMTRYNKLKEAIELYQNSLALYRKSEDLSGFAKCLGRQAVVFRKANQPQQALKLLDQEAGIYKKLGDSEGIAANLIGKGLLAGQSGQSEKALEFFKAVEPHARDHPQRLAESCKYMGDLYKVMKQTGPAVEMYRKAEGLYKASGNAAALVPIQKALAGLPQPKPEPPPPPKPGAAAAGTAAASEEPPQTPAPDQPMEITSETQNILDQVALLTDKKSRDFSPFDAEQLLRRAIDEAQVKGSQVDQATLLEKLGDVFHYPMAMEDNASIYLKRAEAVWQTMGRQRQVAMCLGKQAIVMLNLSKEREAFALFDREEQIWRQLDDPLQLAYCFNERAWVCVKSKAWDTALEYLDKSEEQLRSLGEKAHEKLADNWWEQGAIYGELNQHHKQARFWKQSVDLARKAGAPNAKGEKLLNKLLKKRKIRL